MPPDDPSFADFRWAMDCLLDQVDWTFYPDAGPDPDDPTLPYATHAGVLHTPIGDLPCYQLNTGERIFDAETVIRLFGLDEGDLDEENDDASG